MLLTGQNLIPNGNFELGDLPCDFPSVRDENLVENWYDVFGSLSYQRQECEPNNISDFNALSGAGYVTLGGSVRVNGIVSGDFFGNRLLKTLTAGTTYYLTLYGRSNGISHVDEEALQDCELSPPKTLTVYIGSANDTFEVVYETGVHLFTDIRPVDEYRSIEFTREITIPSNETTWIKYNACFEAVGNESHIGFSSPLGKAQVRPPCEIITDAQLDTFSNQTLNINRYFHFFSFDIDNVGLYELPDKLEAQDSICRYQYNLVDVRDYLPDIPVWDQATFTWQDGFDEPVREMEDIGRFNIDVAINCRTIPLTLTLLDADCPSPVYVPNVFSPNNDGVNDHFQPHFNPFYEIDYMQLEVFSRWGAKVFATQSIDGVWDGIFKGKQLDSGTYVWSLKYRFKGFSREELISGSVVLMR